MPLVHELALSRYTNNKRNSNGLNLFVTQCNKDFTNLYGIEMERVDKKEQQYYQVVYLVRDSSMEDYEKNTE